jgi:hydroxymethylbilane synthase
MSRLRIGSRGSQLALWQTNHIAAMLRARGHQVEIEVIKTTGDKITDVALSQVGAKGMFTKEIEDALAEGRVDLAVHSLKDLPTQLPPGFELAAVTSREDPRDVFLSLRYKNPQELPQRARVGTSSLRRQAQLKALRPDLEVIPLRGNVDTRLRKLMSSEFDAIILAAAGLNRLGIAESEAVLRHALAIEVMCPAAGQGALAIEIRAGDATNREALAFLDDRDACAATTCERALLEKLGGGCQVPIGAYAEAVAQPHASGSESDIRCDRTRELRVTAVVARPDGSELLRERQTGTDPIGLGQSVAEALLAKGARKILDDVYGSRAAVPQQP